MRSKILLFGLIAVISAIAGAYFGARQLAPEAPQTNAVDRLFSQSLPDTSGQAQALSQWKGKTLVVNFWATWCAPCVDEMPELSALQTEISHKNMQIIGVGIDTAENIRAFSTTYNISYPLYTGGIGGTELTRLFGNQGGGLPFTVLVAPDGTVQKTYLGRLNMDALRQDLNLGKAVEEKNAINLPTNTHASLQAATEL